MFVQLNSIIVDADAANRQEMSDFLAKSGVNIIAALPTVETLPPLLSVANPPRLVIVNIDPNPSENLQRVGHLIRQFPAITFFVMSAVVDATVVMEAMHQGVKDFVPLPVNQQKFQQSLERVAASEGDEKHAKIVHVIPTMGGCGATSIACNVAASLARHAKTLILDLDLIGGAVGNAFDLRPRYSIADVMDLSTDLDKALIDNAIAVHRPTGLAVLARPEAPEDSLRVSRQGLTRLLGITSRIYDYIIIDSSMSLDPLYAAAIQSADVNLLVMQLNVPSAKNTERFMGAIRRLGLDANRMQVVVNRAAKKGWDIEPADVERALGVKISWMIPNDFRNAIAAINYGEPVVMRAPRSELSESLAGLTQMLNGKSRK
ncbi:MAG TPA: AAA family ATPase [Tepidisphaeraceae bacterium]|jgi:pilus assembly protein CpaE